MPRLSRRKVSLGILFGAAVAFGLWWTLRRQPLAPTLIFEGVTYGCDRLEADSEGSGLVHWVQVDLTSPGIGLYVTPLDPDAVAEGWQFRLRSAGSVVAKENLAVAINGTLFESDSAWIPLPGDVASAVETTVAEHQVSHVWEHTYLMWFEDDLTPHMETSVPPSESVLKKARWAIGGQAAWLKEGKIWESTPRTPVDSRTVIGIDRQKMLLFLAAFENASYRRALEKLSQLGARDGMLLDGGDSTSMALGKNAQGVRPGRLLGGWRPVATHFGVRARALR